MVRVLRYPRLCALSCAGAMIAAVGRDLCLSRELLRWADVLLVVTLILLSAGLCLISCRFLADGEGVGVGFLFRMRRTAWKDLLSLGTLCCNGRRMYLYGLYKTSPDFLHMLHRAPQCGSWGFVVPMSRRLAGAVEAYSPYEIDLYTGVRRRREKGMRPLWHHAAMQLLTSVPCAATSLGTAAALILRAGASPSFSACAALTLGASLLVFIALRMLWRAYAAMITCPCISQNGVSAGRGLYLAWDEVRFGYVHRMAQVSGLFLLSAPQGDLTKANTPPVRCLSMPDSSTLLLAYLTYCPHAASSRYPV